jgi:uncharacterized protein (TIGR01777 family)
MNILITGGTGLIGKKLVLALAKRNVNRLVLLTRKPEKTKNLFPFPHESYYWDSTSGLPPQEALKNIHAIFHLAGEGVADGRWTEDKKKKMIASRVQGTQSLLKAFLQYNLPFPQFFLSASAIGFYGDRGQEVLQESSSAGQGFLSSLVQQWEDSLFKTAPVGSESLRKVALRIGVVLACEGGALQKMLPPFRLGLGGPIGHGHQIMSWIHVDDLVKMMLWCLDTPNAQGIYNACAPHPVDNKTFTRTLGRTLKRPTLFPVPLFILRGLLGEMSSILIDSTSVLPKKSLAEGFSFQYAQLEQAFNHILDDITKKKHRFEKVTWVPKTQEQVFQFFSEAQNLETITPPYLQFKVLKLSTPTIQEGTLIDYTLKLHGLPLYWQTLIKTWSPPHSFSDFQLQGPYTEWHHTHTFTPYANGTLMSDSIIYKLPLGDLGHYLGYPFVKKDIANIFKYREDKITQIFKQGA